jgi:hypothetical protein
MNVVLYENEQYIESEARAALARMDAGVFGRCEACDKPIALARLEAIPYVRFCIRCAAENELRQSAEAARQVNLDDGRPRNPTDTLAPEGEMQESRSRRVDPLEFPPSRRPRGDVHAAGTAGGGTAVGGLAGSNEADGDPNVSEVEEATASGRFDAEDDRVDDRTPRSGHAGGAVGGTPARKRSV